MITAPFNFVPLNENVFFPTWSQKVTHDIPFEDGQSGDIYIKIKAESPIFIRNREINGNHVYTSGDRRISTEFCNNNGIYYIPGTSVKGMVRNVLEIMSYSKMKFYDDNTYAVRDLRNSKLYSNHFKVDKISCGWLRKIDKEYIIEDCGKPGWIEHNDVNDIAGIKFASKFMEGSFDSGNNSKQKSAKYKYSLVKDRLIEDTFDKKGVDKFGKAKYKKGKAKKGTLVFTGQATSRKNSEAMGDGKGHEFVFFESTGVNYIDEKCFKNFKFAYFDNEKNESEDWSYWKRKLRNDEKVPVFFRKNDEGEVEDFGLSFLYKLPYKHSIKDGLYPSHYDISHNPDLAETIFGYTDGVDAASLKGRVSFSHFKNVGDLRVLSKQTVILGKPRASYYPIYVRQKDGCEYATFMNDDVVISGWKRYPVHSIQPEKSNIKEETITTSFEPLDKGVAFEGKMRFHNLRKAELGALISALTFHNNASTKHNIGLAKSLGYGKISLEIKSLNDTTGYFKDKKLNTYLLECMKAYEQEISMQIKDWSNSEVLKELFTMATEQTNSGDSRLDYLKKPQDFSKNKKTKPPIGPDDYLKNYSLLKNIQINSPKSHLNEEERRSINVIIDENIKKLRREHMQKDFELLQKSNDLNLMRLFISKYEGTQEAEKMSERLDAFVPTTIDINTKEKEFRALANTDSMTLLNSFRTKYQNYREEEIKLYIVRLKNKIEQKMAELKEQAKEEKNKANEQIESFKKRVENQIKGTGIKKIFTVHTLPKQLGKTDGEIKKIINDLSINIQENGNLDVNDIKKIIDYMLSENNSNTRAEETNEVQMTARELAKEVNVSIEMLLTFAEEENINIQDDDIPLSIETITLVKEYI